jgi:hypothetical protein
LFWLEQTLNLGVLSAAHGELLQEEKEAASIARPLSRQDVLVMWDLIAWLNFGCWGICFWWMHRLSSRQERMLVELHEQGQRIEHLSRAEHELLRDLHPTVENIQSGMEEVATAIADK